MARFVQETKVTVLWALPSGHTFRKLTWVELLRHLTMQALQQNNEAVCRVLSHDFNVKHVASATSDQDWETVLLQVLSGIPLAYIVIDLRILENDVLEEENIDNVLQSIDRLLSAGCQAPPTVLKLAMLHDRRTRSFASAATHTLSIDKLSRQARYKKKTPQSQRGHTAKMKVPHAFQQRGTSSMDSC